MDDAVAVIAAHLGVVDEDAINNMSIEFFTNVLKALGKKLNYESISNLYGNSFAIKDAQKYITKAFPLSGEPKKLAGAMKVFDEAKVYKIKGANANEIASIFNATAGGSGDDFSYLGDMFKQMANTTMKAEIKVSD